MKKHLFVFTIAIIPFLFCNLAEAERSLPPKVEPVVYKGVKFIAPNTPEKMGYVEAWNIAANKKIWQKKVYNVIINPIMEADVQWVFIKDLSIKNDKLIIVNETGNKYEIDIKSNVPIDSDEKALELKNIEGANSILDLQRAIERGDYRFVGICGYACWAPGVDKQYEKYIDKYGIKIIKGTSDVIENEEHARIQSIAHEYAKKYNQLLLNKIETLEKN